VRQSTSVTGCDVIERQLRELFTELTAVNDDIAHLDKQRVGNIRAAEELQHKMEQLAVWLTMMEERINLLNKYELKTSPSDVQTNYKVMLYLVTHLREDFTQ